MITYNAAISACEKCLEWQWALHLFSTMPEARLTPDVISLNAAISASEKVGNWQIALALLFGQGSHPRPNTISYNATIAACENARRWQLALHLFHGLHSAQLHPSLATYTVTIAACEKARQWEAALVLKDAALASRIRGSPNEFVVMYNSAISACEKARRWQHSLTLLAELRCARLQPTMVTYGAAITACSRYTVWAAALELWTDLRRERVDTDTAIFTAALNACERNWRTVILLLEELRGEAMEPDLYTYNAALTSLAQGRQWQRALQAFDETFRGSVLDLTPNRVSYFAVFCACLEGGRPAELLQFYKEMESQRVELDATAAGAAVDACEMLGSGPASELLDFCDLRSVELLCADARPERHLAGADRKSVV